MELDRPGRTERRARAAPWSVRAWAQLQAAKTLLPTSIPAWEAAVCNTLSEYPVISMQNEHARTVRCSMHDVLSRGVGAVVTGWLT
jgi:hypothetical protein